MKNEITEEIVNLTPGMAAAILSLNSKNRPASNSHTKRLAQAMLDGEWLYNGDAIRVSSEGVLLDGQHRLLAVILSGVTIKARIIYGLAPGCFTTIDTGRRRSARDALAVEGIPNYTIVASAARILHNYRLGNWQNSFSSGRKALSNTAILETVNNTPELVVSCGECRAVDVVVSPGIAGVVHFLFREAGHSVDLLNEFFSELSTGRSGASAGAVFLLRNWLIKNKGDANGPARCARFVYLIKALNAFLLKSDIRQLKYNGTETIKVIPPTR